MAQVPSPEYVPSGDEFVPSGPTSITVHPLKENKRPIGFTAWTDEKPKKKRKKKAKS